MQIHIEAVSKSYPGPVQALADINLTIGVGMFGLLGPNGAGKTTLMRILCTLLEPTSGQITIGDVDRLKEPQRVREMLGYLPQEFGFFKRLSAREYLDFAAGMKNLTARARAEQIPRLLEQVNLTADAHRSIGGYSGGMKRRLGIAQALLGDPKLLVVDEPTAGLDPEERLRLRNLLAELSTDRIVLLSTHVVADVESACSKVAVLDHGRVKFTGSPADLVGGAAGRVWLLDVSADEYARLQGRLPIASARRTDEGFALRIISDSNPLGRGVPAVVTLEDGYLCLMGGKGVPAA